MKQTAKIANCRSELAHLISNCFGNVFKHILYLLSMNDKKYQVFISSTYTDLKEARQYVLEGILSLNHIPNGMELFPASNISSWNLIKQIIDNCDYYILIIGDKYGSISDDGISFTEREYDYAIENELPIIAFLNDDDNIGKSKTELDPEKILKLKKFKEKVKGSGNVNFWKGFYELQAKVIKSFVNLIKTHPKTGWIRGDQQIDLESQNEILRLKQEVNRLEKENSESIKKQNIQPSKFASGEDEILVYFTLRVRDDDSKLYTYESRFSSTWNKIFKWIAPSMLDECKEIIIKEKIRAYIYSEQHEINKKDEKFKDGILFNYAITKESYETLIIQYRALGYITNSNKEYSVRDRNKYYSLTPLGEDFLFELNAIKKRR